MYTIKYVTGGTVDHPPKIVLLWIHAFMDVCDLARSYTMRSFARPAPMFEATVEDKSGATVATYDNVTGWKFN